MSTPGSAVFDRCTTAAEVAASADLRGRAVLVTGASSGLGRETAGALAAAGAELFLVVRDVVAGEEVAARLRADSGTRVHVGRADLGDPASVVAVARQVREALPPLSVLVANAGVSVTPEAHVPHGFDVRFATNHLGHFLLAHLLLDRFAGDGTRLVVVSSAAHKKRPLNFDDLQWQSRARDDLAAYGESKTANILFAQEATRRWSARGVRANAVLPGPVLTGLQRHHGDALLRRIGLVGPAGVPHPLVRPVEQGAATSVWAATAPELAGRGGLVLEDCAVARPWAPPADPWTGYDPDVLDEVAAARLWDHSLDLLAGHLGDRPTPRRHVTARPGRGTRNPGGQSMTVDLTGGLPPRREDVFETAPHDPESREAVNFWLLDDQGRFSMPRIGIEAVSAAWDRPAVLANLGFPDGRVLVGSCVGEAGSPYDENGRPRVRAAGPIELRCLEPFRRWRMTYRGDALDTTIVDQLAGHVPDGPRIEVGIDVDMTMAVPPWIQGAMGEEAARRMSGGSEALFMGGDRYEQLFRASGTLRVGAVTTEFTGTGLRIHRQGVRDTAEFRGHCWQSAVFPSGRAFGYIAFPDDEHGRRAYREGFVFDGEKMLPAVVADAPWLTSFQAEGGPVPLVLETVDGTHRIEGVTTNSTVMAGDASLRKVAAMNSRERRHSMFFHQGGAHYTWDGEQAYGIVERSLPEERVAR